ncbi:MAG: hypothetical protein ACYCPT_02030 [Acidimicrobiales bacterium]
MPSITKRGAGLALVGAGAAVFAWRSYQGGEPSIVLPGVLLAAGATLALTSQAGELLSPPRTNGPQSPVPIPQVGAATCVQTCVQTTCRQRFLATQSWTMPAWGIGALLAGTASLIAWRMLT